MRVLLFTDSDAFAGTERHMLDLARGLRAEGVYVSFAVPSQSPLAQQATIEGIDFTTVEKQGLVDWAAIRTLHSLLKTGQVDIVHAHNGRTTMSAAIAVHMAGRGACVATQHFLEPGHLSHRGLKSIVYRAAHQWVDRHVDRYIAVSESACNQMLTHSPVHAGRVKVIPNGLQSPDKSQLVPVAQIRQELGAEENTPIIISVSRLEPEKDLSSLLRAIESVIKEFPHVLCVVAGEGSQRSTLQEQIHRSKLQNNVRLLGFRSDALSLINAADIFVLPSLVESFGLVIAEAMALAKPVVATRAGGPAEIVIDGVTGILVQPKQPQGLANAILTMLTNPSDASAMGTNGQKRFNEKYTIDKMAKLTKEVYNSLHPMANPVFD